MKIKAKIGFGISIYKHDLIFYYETSGALEGIFYLNLEQADSSIETLMFNIKLSGSLVYFKFKRPTDKESIQFSIRQVAEKLFGKNEGTRLLPDAKLPISEVTFLYVKKAKKQEAKDSESSENTKSNEVTQENKNTQNGFILNMKFSTS
jgi:hypothetical protein